MGAVRREAVDQFRVGFAPIARARRGEAVEVDPFLIARAIALVMRECAVRTAAGGRLLWNEYRVVLARRDFELVRALERRLEADLVAVLAQEVRALRAELVGELRVTVVFDESDELAAGEGVVRVGFVPTAELARPRAGEMTVRLDAPAFGAMAAGGAARPGPADTVFVDDAAGAAEGRCVVLWPGGWAPVPPGGAVVVGRPHAEAPPRFVGLTGASAKISKRHFWIAAGPGAVRIGRLAEANPVHVGGQLLAPSQEMDLALPAEISLSHGELIVTVRRG
jgi:hypothetical protein